MVLEETRFKGVSKKYNGIGVIFMDDGRDVVFGASCKEDVYTSYDEQFSYHIRAYGCGFFKPHDKEFKKYNYML